MIFKWLEPAIIKCEGSSLDSKTFEQDYFNRYESELHRIAERVDWPATKLATAYGRYQILGENLAYLGMKHTSLFVFLADAQLQRKFARAQFYKMLFRLIKRRGMAWPKYLFSMWNGGIRFVPDYHNKMKHYLGW